MCDKDNTKNLTTINSICSVMKFSGENAIGFLNNLLISDLLNLKKNTYHYTVLCNPKGRIISSMWVNIYSEDQITLICPSNMKIGLLGFFNMRKFRLKLDIVLSDDCVLIQDNKIITKGDVIRTNKYSEEAHFYQYMFTKNLPWIHKNNTEKFIPQHVNLDQHENIMSFTKGCYPGQEIIARIKYLGKIKKRMVLIIESSLEQLNRETSDQEHISPIIYFESNNMHSIQIISNSNK